MERLFKGSGDETATGGGGKGSRGACKLESMGSVGGVEGRRQMEKEVTACVAALTPPANRAVKSPSGASARASRSRLPSWQIPGSWL